MVWLTGSVGLRVPQFHHAYSQGTGCGATKITDEGFSYSARGELTDLYELTPHSGSYYHTTASYWANGALNVLSGVPGQTAWTYGIDGEGRLNNAVQGSTNLVTSVSYNPASQPLIISLGLDSDNYTYDPNTGRMTNYTFTVGNPAKSLIGALTWNANGSLRQLQVTDQFNAGGTQTCNYGTASTPGYDDLGRLVSADCGASTWQQNFGYDVFGNLTKTVPTGGTGYAWNPGYNLANNKYTLSGTSYDANGNLLNDSFHTQTWNSENHLVIIGSSCGGSTTVCITYDAFDQIVEKQVGSTYTEILYSPLGKTAVMNGQTLVNTYVPLPGGSTLYETTAQKNFWHTDWLGSGRLSSTGGHTIVFDRAFAPFGEPYDVFGNQSIGFSYTGNTQDTFIVSATTPEPYDTPDREMHPTQGRWISPDPAGLGAVDPSSPQTWNRYAYVMNNPLGSVDPSGDGPPGAPLMTSPCTPAPLNYLGPNAADSGGYFAVHICGSGGLQNSGGNVGYIFAPDLNAAYNNEDSSQSTIFWDSTHQTMVVCATVLGTRTCSNANYSNILLGSQQSIGQDSWAWTFTKSFVSNFFSPQFYSEEFKQDGCLSTFAHATGKALNPLSIGVATDAATGTMAASTIMRFNAAMEYAASRPNYLGGRGLIYLNKSKPFTKILKGNAVGSVAEGGLGYLDGALFQGVMTEAAAAYNGDCQ